jgi:hypothetical protein
MYSLLLYARENTKVQKIGIATAGKVESGIEMKVNWSHGWQTVEQWASSDRSRRPSEETRYS